jgi:hypothetical protein
MRAVIVEGGRFLLVDAVDPATPHCICNRYRAPNVARDDRISAATARLSAMACAV